MTLRVAKPGLLSTVQDRGRHGLQHLGIVPCGAMDLVAHALANALVGNDPDAATLELTIIGPELVFGCDGLIIEIAADQGDAAKPRCDADQAIDPATLERIIRFVQEHEGSPAKVASAAKQAS